MTLKNAYGAFSKYYDFLGWNKFAESASVRLRSFMKLHGAAPKSILDLACGTGELEWLFRETPICIVGVDASKGMLKAARKKCPGARFALGDAAAVRLAREFDMVLLLFDSANHMNSLSHLKRVFKNARRHLKEGGFFVFDLLSDAGLEKWEHIDIRRGRDYTVISNGYYYPDDPSADIFIEAFVRTGRGFERVCQKIVERTYRSADVFRILKEAGFSKVTVSSYDPAEELEHSSRLWFICN